MRTDRRRFLGQVVPLYLLKGIKRHSPEPAQSGNKVDVPKDGVPAIKSTIFGPRGICFDSSNNLFIADSIHRRIRRVDGRTGVITTVAGNGADGTTGDNGPAKKASLKWPIDVQVDLTGNLYISDMIADRVRKIDSRTGRITTIAGRDVRAWEDSSTDGDPAVQRSIDGPKGLTFDNRGNLYLVESSRLLRIDLITGRMTTVAGLKNDKGFTGDSGPARAAKLRFPSSATIDSKGNIFISDTNNWRIRRITASSGKIETIYRKPEPPFINLAPRPSSGLGTLVLDEPDHLYFVDENAVKQMNLSNGSLTTVAGTYDRESVIKDGSLAVQANFGGISGLAVDRDRNFYVSAWLANRVWKIDKSTRKVTTVAGNGLPKHPVYPIL